MSEIINEVIFILDRSGSMGGLESDTIGGYNSFLEQQRKSEGITFITTVLFNETVSVLHNRRPIGDVREMTMNDYTAGGCTALLDAVGETVSEIERKQNVWDERKPDNTVVVIITDGLENYSHKYTYREVHDMISAMREAGWKFVFLGANIDSPEVGESLGISRNLSKNYRADSSGTRTNFRAVSNMMSKLDCFIFSEEDMESELLEIDEDFFRE